ncbi:cytochrome c oxidase assembly protein [Porticoccus sp.]|uniref:cytochrome c oxidase assembly protein n=1 Tax=Porticoccus sp. TaxID=2024853 RepID=UPI003F695536
MWTNPTRPLIFKLLGGVVCMFAFAIFVMPPLYDMFCEVTGIGGKTAGPYVASEAGIDTSRTIKVQFVATNNAAMPWQFSPKVYEVVVHPGEATEVVFYAKNSTHRDMVAQAIPNVTPFNAASYFHKTECFCFNQQPLKAGEEADLPLVFIVDRDLPRAVKTITLSYTLFDITDRVDNGSVAKLN